MSTQETVKPDQETSERESSQAQKTRRFRRLNPRMFLLGIVLGTTVAVVLGLLSSYLNSGKDDAPDPAAELAAQAPILDIEGPGLSTTGWFFPASQTRVETVGEQDVYTVFAINTGESADTPSFSMTVSDNLGESIIVQGAAIEPIEPGAGGLVEFDPSSVVDGSIWSISLDLPAEGSE